MSWKVTLNAIQNPIPRFAQSLIIAGWIGTLLWLERKRTLRRIANCKLVRDLRNLGVAAGSGIVMQFMDAPVAFYLAAKADENGWGLLPRLPFPPLLRGLLALTLLDYTLYLWHFLTHRVPFLWRFHQVHHLDVEMDATTALRFHFGEIAISVLFRAGQIILIGPSRLSVAVWQMFLIACILFHHSNVRLPIRAERRLARLLVTPRLHGIHHSVEPKLVNSNWSSGLTIWDWLHGTLRTEVPQATIVMGVAGFRDSKFQNLKTLYKLPFRSCAPVPPMPPDTTRQPLSSLAE
ncbi:MAG TPA: sterol desaturase family protein [Bryobacteraceae bacterium]|nr:sterol desaturase family protein [Bryobacteraceae bacterium]